MTDLAPLLVAAIWIAFACGPLLPANFAAARKRATLVCFVALLATGLAWLAFGRDDSAGGVLSIGGWHLRVSNQGFAGIAPMVISAIGVVAMAMSDSLSHSRLTLRRMLALLAVAMGFVAVREPAMLALLWTLSPWIVWTELRERFGRRGVAQLFAVYHVASVVLFLAAVALGQLGWTVLSPLLFLAAIGLREAVLPGHSWFPRFVEMAPLGLVVAFIAPQLGVVVQVEVLGDALPADLAWFIPYVGGATALIAAALGLVQTSARRSLAYLLMSQTAIVSLGLDGSSEIARVGALLLWQVLALATTGFAMTLSVLEARRGALSLANHSGSFARTPRMAAGFMLMGLASVGFPTTLGFIAEDLLAQGAMETHPISAFVLIGATALNGMTVMRAFFRLFSGHRIHTGETDLTLRESCALTLLLLALVLGGLAPNWLISQEFGAPDPHSNRSVADSTAVAIDADAPAP